MACLFLYTDLSPSWPWNFTTIHANRSLLAKHNIVLGPDYPWISQLIKGHASYWSIALGKERALNYLDKLLQEIGQQLHEGKNILLMGTSFNLDEHQALAQRIQNHSALAGQEVRAVLVAGRPACSHEQIWMRKQIPFSSKAAMHLVQRMSALSSILTAAQEQWGKDSVALLPDLSESIVPEQTLFLPEKIFSTIGAPSPTTPKILPRHPSFLASWEARRLMWSMEVRENAWPVLDEGQVMECLRTVERNWEAGLVSPLKYRKALLREGEEDLHHMEELMGLPTGALACPNWMAAQIECDAQAPLPAEKVQAFAQALPPSLRDTLLCRFHNDALLLTEDQKALAGALAVTGTPYIDIGDPVSPVLTVLTMTYNQEKYIAQCMDSVLSQRTNFPIQHIVLDHHSTDATPNIIDSYAKEHKSIRPVLLSQYRSSENVRGLFLRCRTRYVALCDGDDYFTDPFKLQKQVDFLENNPNCGLCFHPVSVVFENGDQPSFIYPHPNMLPRGKHEEYYLADLTTCNFIQTNSVVYRWRFIEGLPDWFDAFLNLADWYWHLLHAETGKIGFIPEVMSVYRRHTQAMYNTSFQDPVEHRRMHGMEELRTYHVVNEHFKGRYFRSFSSLANGVFSDFFKIYLNSGDISLLDHACTKFPDFAKIFLNSIKIINNNHQKTCS